MEFDFFRIIYYSGVVFMIFFFLCRSYDSLTGKPIIFSFAIFFSSSLSIIFWNPIQIRNLLQFYPITIILIPLIVSGFIIKKDIYIFYNISQSAQYLTEEALENIGIEYDSLKASTLLNEQEGIYLLYSKSKNDNWVNLSKVENKHLRKEIYEEIKKNLKDYGKKDILLGATFLFVALFIVIINILFKF